MTALLLLNAHPGDQYKLQMELQTILPSWEIRTVPYTARLAEVLLREEAPVIIISDGSPGVDIFKLLQLVKTYCLQTSIILWCEYTSVESAVAALKQGACDYIQRSDSNYLILSASIQHEIAIRHDAFVQPLLVDHNDHADEALVALELSQVRMQFLATASNMLTSSLDYDTTLMHLGELCLHYIADMCAIYIRDTPSHGHWRIIRAHDPIKQAIMETIIDEYPPEITPNHIVYQVLSTGRAAFMPDVNDQWFEASAIDERHVELYAKLDMRSFVVVPLQIHEQLHGLLVCITDKRNRAYTPEDLRLFQELGQRASLAIENAHLYETEQQARQIAEEARAQMNMLVEASDILSSSLKTDEISEQVINLIAQRLSDVCLLVVGDQEQIEHIAISQHPKISHIHLEEWHKQLRRDIADHNSMIGRVMSTGEPLAIDNRSTFDQSFAVPLSELCSFQTFLCVPLLLNGNVIGAFLLMDDEANHFSGSEVLVVEELARRTTMAFDNARLYGESQQAIRARDQFISIASHELKTPLTSLMGYISMLKRRLGSSDQLSAADQKALRVIDAQASRLNNLISVLLDLSRHQQGRLSLSLNTIDLRVLTQQVVDEIEPTLNRHRLVLHLPDEAIWIEGDMLRLEQVFQNLIQNAIKYSPQGGVVDITLHQTRSCAEIAIRDQGIGIPSDSLPYLFTRFYRADNATSTQISGMGLGLFIVREIIHLHKGEVSVESTEGQGSCFRLKLPMVEQQHYMNA
jgi:signal transduction histidine kinase